MAQNNDLNAETVAGQEALTQQGGQIQNLQNQKKL